MGWGKRGIAGLVGLSALGLAQAALAANAAPAEAAGEAAEVQPVVVTARLRQEDAQQTPVSLSVVSAEALRETGTNNVSQIVQLVPSANYSSPNPRNTSLTIRGLGSSVVAIAQSNDGLEPGVGFYVDQVYHARPATATFDFLDVERVEVLRGPQGTLFGKNTTAGAVSVVTRAPSFTFGSEIEATAGDFGYLQGKFSVTGPLFGDVVAARFSFVDTHRDGLVRNVRTGGRHNVLQSRAARLQVLIQPTETFRITFSGDNNRIAANCCTQVFVRVGTSLKAVNRQYPALAAGLGYVPASTNPYSRLTDIDANLAVNTVDAGYSGVAEWNLGSATLTSVSAWRWWNWDAANDRDYTSIPIQLLQHIPSRQDQYSQEFRISSNGRGALDYVAGLYAFSQTIKGEPITSYGSMATYWLLGPAPAFPADLLSGYTQDGSTRFHSESYAVFGEATWRLTDQLSLTGGLRHTQEIKDGRYATTVSGGLPATGSLLNSKLSILRPQAYAATDKDGSLSGRASLSYQVTERIMAYANFAKASKSGGINMSGLPLDASNNPALASAVVKPERNTSYELGVKSQLFDKRLVLNADVFNTDVRDFQTNVVDTGPGALRGYLANIEHVRVRGVEADAAFVVGAHLSGRIGFSRSDGRYLSYRNGPCPLEKISSATTVCDLTGLGLSNLPKFVWSAGLEYRQPIGMGEAFARIDYSSRTQTYGDPTDSMFTVIDGYELFNAALGLRSRGPWEVQFWAHNLFDEHYLQNVTVQSGNSGLVVGTPGDPRTVGMTLRAKY